MKISTIHISSYLEVQGFKFYFQEKSDDGKKLIWLIIVSKVKNYSNNRYLREIKRVPYRYI